MKKCFAKSLISRLGLIALGLASVAGVAGCGKGSSGDEPGNTQGIRIELQLDGKVRLEAGSAIYVSFFDRDLAPVLQDIPGRLDALPGRIQLDLSAEEIRDIWACSVSVDKNGSGNPEDPAGYYGIAFAEKPEEVHSFTVALRPGTEVLPAEEEDDLGADAVSGLKARQSALESRALSLTFREVEDGGPTMVMESDQAVLAGPMKEYKVIGSVDQGEPVTVLAEEDGHYYIAYEARNKGRRRGFVPVTSIRFDDLNLRPLPVVKSGWASYVTRPVRVFDGPARDYYADGSLAKKEGVTVFEGTDFNGYTEVEYGTAKGTRRGFVPSAAISAERIGVLVKVRSSAGVYSGPDTTYYKAGAVGQDELVVAIERDSFSLPTGWDEWLYVEYNKTDALGRKRGYVRREHLDLSSIDETALPQAPYASLGRYQGRARGNLDASNGPGTAYADRGLIFDGERVSVLGRAERGFTFIEYNTKNSRYSKRGFVPTSKLTIVDMSGYAYPVPQSGADIYARRSIGSSARSNPIYSYQIGSRGAASATRRVAVVLTGLHGFEDMWNRDAEVLVRVANRTIEKAASQVRSAGSLNGWELHVIPVANPDGLLYGWTNDGPGRCTLSGYDLNRSFPYAGRDTPIYTKRNATAREALGTPEASALHGFIKGLKDSLSSQDEMVLYDLQGWLDMILDLDPRKNIAAGFKKRFPSLKPATLGPGQLAYWAQRYGIDAVTVELPPPSSPADAERGDTFEKGADAILEYLLRTSAPEPVRKTLKVVQLGDSYSAGPGGSGETSQGEYPHDQIPGCYRSVEDLSVTPNRLGNWAYRYASHLASGREAGTFDVNFRSWACSGAQTPEIAGGISFLGTYGLLEGGDEEKKKRAQNGFVPDGSRYVAETVTLNRLELLQEITVPTRAKIQKALSRALAGCEARYRNLAEYNQCVCEAKTAWLETAGNAANIADPVAVILDEPLVTKEISCSVRLDKQVNHLEGDEDLVLLTIGGNDVGFASIIQNCYVLQRIVDWGLYDQILRFLPIGQSSNAELAFATMCQSTLQTYGKILKETFKPNLVKALSAIAEKAERARIVLLQYPRLDRDRIWGGDDFRFPETIYQMADVLDSIQAAAVAEVSAKFGNRVIFINQAIKDAFKKHEPCPSKPVEQCPNPWIKDSPHAELLRTVAVGAGILKSDYPLQFTFFHPNSAGHLAVFEVLKQKEALWLK